MQEFNYQLTKEDKDFMEYVITYHNINKIPRYERMGQYVSYDMLAELKTYFSQQSYTNLIIQETQSIDNAIEPTPIKDVFDILQTEVDLKGWQFQPLCKYGIDTGGTKRKVKYNNAQEKVITIAPDIQENIAKIDKIMRENGYYRIAINGERDKDDMPWVYLLYNPIKKTPLKDVIEQYKLYHFTPAFNEQSIIENGLIAKNEHPLFKYSEKRVYMLYNRGILFDVQDIDNDFLCMLKENAMNIQNSKPGFDGKYIAYNVNPKKLPGNMEFYQDPNAFSSCFVINDIPIDAVRKYIVFTINDIRVDFTNY